MNTDSASPGKARIRVYEADEIIVREGDICTDMYKVLSGSVILYMNYGKDDEQVLGICSASRCFGEWNMLTDQPSTYTVVAYDRALLMHISKETLESFVMTNPKNVIDIMENMARNMVLMRKNMDLMLEEIHEKGLKDSASIREIQRRVLYRYSMNETGSLSSATFTANV